MLNSWNTAADGSGSTFTSSTTLTGSLTVYAQWVQIDHLTIVPTSPTFTAGATEAFIVHAFGPGPTDLIGDYTDRVTFSSDNADDSLVGGDSIYFRKAGDRQVTAALTSDTSIRVSTTVTVMPATTDSIGLTLSATTVAQGGKVTATVTGFDVYGNETGDLTSGATLTSDHPDDIINGAEVKFPHASPHVITAHFDTGTRVLSDSVTVEVTALQPSGLAATGSDSLLPGAATSLLLLLLGGILLYRRRRALE